MAEKITRPELEILILETLNNDKFRDLIRKDPKAALDLLEIDATPERIDAISGVDPDALKALAASFGMPIHIN